MKGNVLQQEDGDMAGRRQDSAAPPAPPEESRWQFEEGDEIAPGRTAVKLLGGGFRYEAYLAWDDHLHNLVVAKVVRPGLVDDRRTLRGLASEVEMLERLNHPVLLRAFDAVLDGPRPHVVLEHLEGPRLSSLVRRYGPLPPEQLIPLGLQLAAAAHYIAREEIVHLDIKPSNIIMGAPARLIDLSVALPLSECEDIGSPVGTDAYMAPEQTRTDRSLPVGPPADVWGIGATLYRAATGHKAFGDNDTDSEVPEERWPQLSRDPEPLQARIAPAVAEAIMDCLRHDPGARPTAAEVAARFEPALDVLPKPRISKMKPRVLGT